MKRTRHVMAVIAIVGLLFGLLVVPGGSVTAQERREADPAEQGVGRLDYYVPPPLDSQLLADGNTVRRGVPARVVIADPVNPVNVRYVPPPEELGRLDPSKAVSSFGISYYAAGEKDPWDEPCFDFPAEAKTAFSAAAAIWANTVQSTVPITIKACWASLASSTTLGYSGGGPLHRNFTGAKRTATWYMGSLANAMAGKDLSTTSKDMYITYNKNFSWYYGTDGATPSNKHDLMSVVLHEIGHGLNFAGSMDVSSGKGYYGYETEPINPNIYDVKMKNGAGTYLTDLGNGTTALATALKSGVWFHGTYAKSANGGNTVKMYTPGTWSPGSSYSHLDYTTFNDTTNELMVYAISAGEAIHDPGPVARGLLRDLGWNMKSTGGFYYTFTTSAKGWTKRPGGNWGIYKGTLYTNGQTNKWSTISQNTNYVSFEYSVRIKRNEAGDGSYFTNGILIRGNPTTYTTNNAWQNSYLFGYTDRGKFGVFKRKSGTPYTLKDWTTTTAIKRGDWNVLKVVAVGTGMKFLINGKLVWSGTDKTFKAGNVGLAMYRNDVVERMSVDWARLDVLLGGSSAAGDAGEPSSPEALRISHDGEETGRWEE